MANFMLSRELRADLFRYTGKPAGWKTFWKGFGYPGFRFTYFFRQASRHSKWTLRGILYRLAFDHYFWHYGYQIPLKTEIGEGLYIGHFGHIVVNGRAKIGRNCNLAPGVTIGQANRGQKKGFPRIGDNVWIGTNAVVVGSIDVGDNVLIAPGAFVNFDVPDNSLVIGNPAKVVPQEEAVRSYIEKVMEGEDDAPLPSEPLVSAETVRVPEVSHAPDASRTPAAACAPDASRAADVAHATAASHVPDVAQVPDITLTPMIKNTEIFSGPQTKAI